MNWNNLTEAERIEFCDKHFNEGRLYPGRQFLRTSLPWDDLSPTTQLFLNSAGIENKAVWEA